MTLCEPGWLISLEAQRRERWPATASLLGAALSPASAGRGGSAASRTEGGQEAHWGRAGAAAHSPRAHSRAQFPERNQGGPQTSSFPGKACEAVSLL